MTNNHRFAHIYDQEEEMSNLVYGQPSEKFEELMDLISFEGFEFTSLTYRNQEIELLQPQLERLGYTEIIWLPGETDSFGPLSRVCRAFDKDGELHWFFYG